MYLHLGNDIVIKKSGVVGIYDIENTTISKRTREFLENAEKTYKTVAEKILHMVKIGRSDEEILEYVSDTFYNEYTKTVYPKDAMELNTRIMIELIKKEL